MTDCYNINYRTKNPLPRLIKKKPKKVSRTLKIDQRNYIAPFEVVVHNSVSDCWVSFLGKVYNITPLLREYAGEDCIRPLVAFAGKDINDWFDESTGDIQHYIHPITGARVPHCPYGRIPHVQIQVPSTEWRPLDGLPWWKDDAKYLVGRLTKKVRPVRITNMCICQEAIINVCCEDTISRIMERYRIFNSEPESYICRALNKNLVMNKTLEENGIIDEREEYYRLGLPQSLYIPVIFMYYSDDFKHVEE
ncbi:cytochrome b5 domain-containing protein 1 [Onthophagus taurus]|uniref:cytochrome b5 domain-containing protein 1 n=1 Tax=Onthophagus taurus TaxID=166361 RepID=UPI000C20611C|nr:cytochrome b5 domain-containing protein 1 [Onthophagus taurus]